MSERRRGPLQPFEREPTDAERWALTKAFYWIIDGLRSHGLHFRAGAKRVLIIELGTRIRTIMQEGPFDRPAYDKYRGFTNAFWTDWRDLNVKEPSHDEEEAASRRRFTRRRIPQR